MGRIPKLVKFFENIVSKLTLMGRNNSGVPFLVFSESVQGHIGTTDDKTIGFVIAENISFSMKTLICFFSAEHS